MLLRFDDYTVMHSALSVVLSASAACRVRHAIALAIKIAAAGGKDRRFTLYVRADRNLHITPSYSVGQQLTDGQLRLPSPRGLPLDYI